MAKVSGTTLSIDNAVNSMEKMLMRVTNNGKSPVTSGQFNFQDNTPNLMNFLTHIPHEECNLFLYRAADVLKNIQ